MADLNALIAQGYQFQAPPDPFTQYGKMQQLQQGEQTNQLNQMKMQEYQRGIQEQNALRGLDPASATYINDVTKINPKLGFEFAKSQQEAKTARTEGQIKDTKLLTDTLALLPDMYARADTPDKYIALHESIHANPILGNYLKSIGATKEQGRAKINEAIANGTFDDLRIGSMQKVEDVAAHLADVAYGQSRKTPAPGAVPMGAPNTGVVTPLVPMPNEPMVAPAVTGLNADQTRAQLAVAPNALAPQVAPVNALAAAPTVDRVKQIDDRLLEGNTSKYKNSKGWADEKKILEAERTELVKVQPDIGLMKALNLPNTQAGFATLQALKNSSPTEFERAIKAANLNPEQTIAANRAYITHKTTHAPAAVVNVSNIQEKEEGKEYGKFLVDDYRTVKASAGLALKSLPAIDSNLAILNKGFSTGFGTETVAAGAKVLGALGVKDAEKYATDAQTFLANANNAVLQKQLEQKGVQTAADADRITSTGAQFGNTKDANVFILKVAKAQLQRDIEQRDFYGKWRDKNETFNGAENAWFSGPGGKSLFDRPELKAYAAAPPPSGASLIPGSTPAAPASNITQQRQDANAAIAKGAPAAAVRQRFKQNTGEEL
jgi:hypothetical protein